MKLSLRVRVEKDVIVRISRILPGKGIINVALNQEVAPSDIIGLSDVSSGFRTINLSQDLEVGPKEVEKYLKRGVGQRIYKGELLAYKQGSILGGKKAVVAPTDGILDYLNPETGEIKMTLLPRKIELPAGVYGIVDGVDNQRGKVTIKAQASRIHGMFGCGKIRDGILEFVCKREDMLIGSMISPKNEGQILIGGSLIYKEALSTSISCGVNGIITGGMNSEDYKSMAGGRLTFPKKLENDVGISILCCEGFGSIPIAEDIYNILREYDGKFVSIDGTRATLDLPSFQSNSLTHVKSVNLPPLDNFPKQVNGEVDLKVGLGVRVIGSSYLGEQGKIISVDSSPTLLASGLKGVLATIETKRRKIKVPVVNLEAIDYI